MRLTFDTLSVMAAIVREGSINQAASVLQRAPSTVWYAVKKAERELGFRLMERRGRGVVLTAAGRELLARGGAVLDLMGDLERSMERVARGWEATLRIAVAGVVPDRWILELVAELQRECPDLTVALSREVLAGNWDALIARRADFVIGAPVPPPGGYSLRGANLGRLELVYAVAPSHPLAGVPEPLSADAVRQHRVAVIPDTTRSLQPLTIGLYPEQPVLRVPDFVAKRTAQVLGLAGGWLPLYLAKPEIEAGRLVAKRVPDSPLFEPLWVGWREDHTGQAQEWLRTRLFEVQADWITR
ncbi:MAG: LysR family transcriptional regulator [Gammaproteobacteria bacterium]